MYMASTHSSLLSNMNSSTFPFSANMQDKWQDAIIQLIRPKIAGLPKILGLPKIARLPRVARLAEMAGPIQNCN